MPTLAVVQLYRGLMVFNATFNNISVISVEETGVPGENHQPAAIPRHWSEGSLVRKVDIPKGQWSEVSIAQKYFLKSDKRAHVNSNQLYIYSKYYE